MFYVKVTFLTVTLQPPTRYIDLSHWHSALEEEIKRRANKDTQAVPTVVEPQVEAIIGMFSL